ncbi:hypothetical protein [Agaribacterium sp. ZY112]|uniref:hypothetical protein n=1 Tax=Agaribacterium sp. ZY112 TaxID=3233574 RepID=UPI0035243593
MTMREFLILSVSILFSGLGFLLPEDQLLMMAGESGELFKPVSSGSEDPFLIKVALGSYVLTGVFSAVSLFVGKGRRYIFRIYLGNGAFYILVMALASIDSSVFAAAQSGNWLPLGQLALWLVALLVVIGTSFNKAMYSELLFRRLNLWRKRLP